MSARLLTAGFMLVGFACACSPHDVTENPEAPVALPDSYGGETPATAAQAPKPERWWTAFGHPDLDRLIERALAGNFDLHAAWARLWQSEALADQAGAPRWPQLEASLGGRVSRGRFFPGAPTRTDTFASGSLAASYEVDIWDKLGSTARAAALERDAAADAVQALAMTLTARVAETWFDLVRTRAQRALLEEQLATSTAFLDLLKARFSQGMATAVEVSQQEQLAIGTRSELVLTHSREAVLTHQLAVLVGEVPGRVQPGAGAQLPELPPLPATGVPSELLQRRPDLRAAQRRVEAADNRIAAAIADRYPSLRLTAQVSSEPGTPNDWLLDPIWSLAAGLTAPIFDGGRRAAEVERRRAMMAELVANYGQTVLTAMVEVQDALVQEQRQRERIVEITNQLQVADTTLDLVRARYGQGAADFLSVLTALTSQQQVQLNLLQARRELLSHRIQLCRALGDTWTTELKRPEDRKSVV